MATAITTLICVAFLIIGFGTLTQGSFNTATLLTEAWNQMETSSESIADTKIVFNDSAYTSPTADVTLKNTGREIVGDFDRWDLWVQYYQTNGTYNVRRLSYTTAATPGNNEWTVRGLYADASDSQPEVIGPNVLDPQEEMIIRFTLNPAARSSPKNQVAVSTPNGVTASTLF
jgi:hypothetical protein